MSPPELPIPSNAAAAASDQAAQLAAGRTAGQLVVANARVLNRAGTGANALVLARELAKIDANDPGVVEALRMIFSRILLDALLMQEIGALTREPELRSREVPAITIQELNHTLAARMRRNLAADPQEPTS